jgi:hypothetical protein
LTASSDLARSPRFIALTALSLSLGWGIRGNYGHEYGAMIPGALAALAAVLLSGRADWQERIAYFATFGALGWSFGGSMSYMQVIAYTHSGHSSSVLYGFACLFVIGFLWAALGGAGTALPAVVEESFLAGLIAPMYAVFLLWWLQGVSIAPWLKGRGYNLDWYDTDWLAALLALAAVLAVAAIRRRLDGPTSLILHLAAGWWAGFLILVLALQLRMTPPRGDNWAGCVGMTVGMLWYCRQASMVDLARAALVCGFIGGIGFAGASMLKLVEVTSGLETNWHSVLEQTTGLFNGVGVAVAVAGLARWRPPLSDARQPLPASLTLSLGLFLIGITYLNLRKNVAQWVAAGALAAEMAGIAAWIWFELGYMLLAVAMLVLFVRHRQRPLPIIPESRLGKCQLLYVGLLWWMVIGNFARALVSFTAVRLVTEGVIYLVALACTLILLTAPDSAGPPPERAAAPRDLHARPGLMATVAVGLLAAVLAVVGDWVIVRAIYGDRFAGHAGRHIRFGPSATINRTESR